MAHLVPNQRIEIRRSSIESSDGVRLSAELNAELGYQMAVGNGGTCIRNSSLASKLGLTRWTSILLLAVNLAWVVLFLWASSKCP